MGGSEEHGSVETAGGRGPGGWRLEAGAAGKGRRQRPLPFQGSREVSEWEVRISV